LSEAFEGLKNKVCSPPVLALPTLTEELVLDTDTTDEQLGCFLQQRGKDGHLHSLGYYSRSVNPAELNYSATEKEALAVVWAIKRLRPYLDAARCTVRTYHSALTLLFSVDGDNRPLPDGDFATRSITLLSNTDLESKINRPMGFQDYALQVMISWILPIKYLVSL
jgi:hypothetical protein